MPINIPENLYHNIKLKLTALSNRDKILQIKLVISKYHIKPKYVYYSCFVYSGIYETFMLK